MSAFFLGKNAVAISPDEFDIGSASGGILENSNFKFGPPTAISEDEFEVQSDNDFIPGIKRGIDQTQASLYGATALVGSAVGSDSVKNWGMQGYQRNMAEAEENPAKQTFKDVYTGKAGIGGSVDWLQGTLGELVPSMAEAAIGTIIGTGVAPGPGSAIGGFASRTILKKSIESMTKEAVEAQIAKGVITEASKGIAETELKKQITKQALMKLGGKVGMGAAVLPLESGGNYAQLLQEKGIDAPGTALFFGALSTSLEYAGGNSELIDQFVDVVGSGSGKAIKSAAMGLITNIPKEVLQEGGQEVFSILNTVANTDEKFLTPANIEQIIEAMGAGAVGGAGGAGVSIGANALLKDKPTNLLDPNKGFSGEDLTKSPQAPADSFQTAMRTAPAEQYSDTIPFAGVPNEEELGWMDEINRQRNPAPPAPTETPSTSDPVQSLREQNQQAMTGIYSQPDPAITKQGIDQSQDLLSKNIDTFRQVRSREASVQALELRQQAMGQTDQPVFQRAMVNGPDESTMPLPADMPAFQRGMADTSDEGKYRPFAGLADMLPRQALPVFPENNYDDGLDVAPAEVETSPVRDQRKFQQGLTDNFGMQDLPAEAISTLRPVFEHEVEPEKINTNPSEAQKEAGNYQKDHIKIDGLNITIENPDGSIRKGKDKSGKEWQSTMSGHYGYFKRTEGKDGDQVDVFIKPGTETSPKVFVVDQVDPGTGKFDEHKAVLGAGSKEEAESIYLANYEKGWKGLGNITEMGTEDFKAWVKDGNRTKKPVFSDTAIAPQTTGLKPGDPVSWNGKNGDQFSGKLEKKQSDKMWFIRKQDGKGTFVKEKDLSLNVPENIPENVPESTITEPIKKDDDMDLRGAIGRNPDGKRIYVDERGARSYQEESGLRVGHPVRLVPTRSGVMPQPHNPKDLYKQGATDYLTIEEIAEFDREKVEKESKEKIDTKEQPTKSDITDFFLSAFRSGKGFANILQARKAFADETGFIIKAGTQDAKMVDEAIETAGVLAARAIIDGGKKHNGTSEKIFDKLVDLQNRMPNLSVRTSTSVRDQAYSTPLPLAWIASELAGITSGKTVYEPSAGNGALLIGSNPEKVTANELNPDRYNTLLGMGFNVIFNLDGTEISAAEKVDAVIGNPPFGVVKDDAGVSKTWKINDQYPTTQIDHAIVFKALESMKDNGWAVFIVGSVNDKNITPEGRKLLYRAKDKVLFYKTLFDNYNVVDHFSLSGDLYAKQGAAWPVDFIVIDGKGKSKLALPGAVPPPYLKTLEELKGKLDGKTTQRPDSLGSSRGELGAMDSSGMAPEGGDPDAKLPQIPDDRPGSEPDKQSGISPGSGKDAGKDPGERRSVTGRNDIPEIDKDGGTRSDVGPDQRTPVSSPVDDGSSRQPADKPDNGDQPGSRRNPKTDGSGNLDGKPGLTDELKNISESDLDSMLDDAFGPDITVPKDISEELQNMSVEEIDGLIDDVFNTSTDDIAIPVEKPDRGRRSSEVGLQSSRAKNEKAIEQYLKNWARREAQKNKPPNRKPKTKKDLLNDFALESLSDVKDAIKGLNALFTPRNTLSSGFVFNEETYKAARPFFASAWDHAKKAGHTLKQLIQYLATQTGAELKPYLKRFFMEQSQQLQPKPKEKAKANSGQVPYIPSSKSPAIETLTPVNMSEAIKKALADINEKHGLVDEYVSEKLGYSQDELKEYFSGEQVDAIALAINNIDKGAGFIIGDQTGVGKGRVVAAMIRFAMERGLTPIFVTEKPNLYTDMYRDLSDIGMSDMADRILITNADQKISLTEDGDKVIRTTNKHNSLLKQMADNGFLDSKYSVIFTTYDQTNKPGSAQRVFLEAMAEKNGMLILDEAHKAGGSEGAQETNEKYPRSIWFRRLIQSAHSTFYSSATYAKRPSTMDLYSKTDMRLAVDDIKDLSGAISAGGVPLQQAVAAMLVEAGQYVRRERSFDGVEYATKATKIDQVRARDVSISLNQIKKFSEEFIEPAISELADQGAFDGTGIGGMSAAAAPQISSVSFASTMHNLISQMLLSLKTQAAVDEAIKAVKEDKKPVITLSNTMGSFIEQYVEDNGLKPGDGIGLKFNDLLFKYLDNTRRYTETKPGGNKKDVIRHYISDDDLGPEGVREFNRVKKLIFDMDLDGLPVSPVDYMIFKLKGAGLNASEITGRNHMIEYRPDGSQRYRMRGTKDKSIAGRTKTIYDFNTDKTDVLILNQSGATGLSLHAVPKWEGHDPKPRVMIIAQAEANIDTHMQMLGRIHRAGQVKTPSYIQLMGDIPSEKRPAAVLAGKMASLNANTTASKDSEVTAKNVVDFINKYGDKVVARLMADFPEMHSAIGSPLKNSDKTESGLDEDGAARKVTGRIPLLPTIKEQEDLYALIEEGYTDLIDQLDAMGENDLEAKTFDTDAKTLKKATVFDGKGDKSPFTSNAFAEEVDMKKIGKSYSSEEVVNLLKENIFGLDSKEARTTEKSLNELANEGRDKHYDKSSDILNRFLDYRNGILDDIEDEERLRAQASRLDAIRDDWERVFYSSVPGSILEIPIGDTYFETVVLGVEQKGNPKNPLALGTWKVTVAVPDSTRKLVVPFSFINRMESFSNNGKINESVLSKFDRSSQSARETRVIMTGNLLAAFARYPKGRIINFADDKGRVRQGILMPAKFDLNKESQGRPITLTNTKDIMTVLSNNIFVRSRRGDFAITPKQDGSGTISVPASKASGSRYYLNSGLIDSVGSDFVKSGNRMKVFVPAGRMKRTLDHLINGMEEVFENAADSVKVMDILGIKTPEFSEQPINQQDGEVQYHSSLQNNKNPDNKESVKSETGKGDDITTGLTPQPDGGINLESINKSVKAFKDGKISVKTVGYRYGEAPESGQSYNSRENKYESGVSMASVFGFDESRGFATMDAASKRKIYYYEGEVIGFGGDDEFVMSNLSPISKAEYNKKGPSYKQSELILKINQLNTAKYLKGMGYQGYDKEATQKQKAVDDLIEIINSSPNPSSTPGEGVQYSSQTPSQLVTISDIQKAFPGQDVSISDDGSVRIRTQGGGELQITSVEPGKHGSLILDMKTGKRNEKGQILGAYRKNKIELVKDLAGTWTLNHEIEHWLEDIGIIGPREKLILDSRINAAKAQLNFELVADQRENRANYIARVLEERRYERDTLLGEIIQKIRDFLDSIRNLFGPSVRKIAREMESGKIYNKIPGQTDSNETLFNKGIIDEKFYSEPTTREQISGMIDKAKSKDERTLARDRFITKTLDHLHFIKERLGDEPYKLHRMLTGIKSATFAMFLEHGPMAWVGDTIAVTERGKGVIPFLRAIGPDWRNLLYWVAAKRAEQLEAEGRENWLDKDARDKLFAKVGTHAKNGQTWAALNLKLQSINKNVLDIAEQAGLIDPESRAEWESNFYIPFYRIMEDPISQQEFLSGPRKNWRHISAQIKKLKGGEAKIGDPLENLLKNWMHLVDASVRNRARQRAFEAGETVGIIEEVEKKDLVKILGSETVTRFAVVKEGATKGRDIFGTKEKAETWAYSLEDDGKGQYSVEPRKEYKVMFGSMKDYGILSFQKNGEPVYFKTTDEDLYESLSELDMKAFNNILMRMMGGAKRILSFGATFGPAFRIRNMIRDTIHTAVVAKNFVPFLDTASGFIKSMKEDKDYIEFMSTGFGFGSSYVKSDDPKTASRFIDKIVRSEGKSAIRRIIDPFKPWDNALFRVWDKIGEASENAARLGLYTRLKSKGYSNLDAGFEARDLLDFSMRGSSGTVQALTRIVPFLNARVQGLYKLSRSANENPKAFFLKSAILTTAALALWSLFKDDDRYKSLEDWDKWTYFHFWIGDQHYRIPKPFEIGALFASLPESVANVMNGTEEGKFVWDWFKFTARDVFNIDMPQMVKPIMEERFNMSTFKGRRIVPDSMKNLKPSEQYMPWTSDTMKMIGGSLNVSPLKLEHFVNGYFSTMGAMVLFGTDAMSRSAMGYPDLPEGRRNPFALGVMDTGDVRSSKDVQRFYDLYEKIDGLNRTLNHYLKTGRREDARNLVIENKNLLRVKKPVTKIRQNLADINDEIKRIYSSNDNSEEKQNKINALNKRRNEITKNLFESLRASE